MRNLITGIQFVQDHVIHFYHLHALDWVDIVSALKASPADLVGDYRARGDIFAVGADLSLEFR